MRCPRCFADSKVLKTVKQDFTERLRQCEVCGYTWQTVEIPKQDRILKHYTKNLFDEEGWSGNIKESNNGK